MKKNVFVINHIRLPTPFAKCIMGVMTALAFGACGQVQSNAQESTATPKQQEHITTASEPVTINASLNVQAVQEKPVAEKPKITCEGVLQQGGAIKCTTSAYAVVEIDGVKTHADENGQVVIGFDRDAPRQENLIVHLQNRTAFEQKLDIIPRTYAISRIDGLPPSQVSTFSQAQLKRIRASSARKKVGFASRQQTLWFKNGFDYPLKDFTKTSPFGAQRILNGIKKKPHYGVDIAAPVGTPIYAPADGVVSLADDDLYFEGAMVLLDHGQGLISMYLHMSEIDVKPGQVVKRGERIGAVGSRGRSTGPHLCWRLKWRNRNLDPELLTKWPKQEAHKHD